MSPLRTFHSSGNSSRLVERRKGPNGVKRAISGNRFPLEPSAVVIVRNLTMRNDFPRSPGRSCVKNVGVPIANRPRMVTRTNTTSQRGAVIDTRATSRPRFTLCDRLVHHVPQHFTGLVDM